MRCQTGMQRLHFRSELHAQTSSLTGGDSDSILRFGNSEPEQSDSRKSSRDATEQRGIVPSLQITYRPKSLAEPCHHFHTDDIGIQKLFAGNFPSGSQRKKRWQNNRARMTAHVGMDIVIIKRMSHKPVHKCRLPPVCSFILADQSRDRMPAFRFDGVQQLHHTGIFPASKSAGQIVEDTAFCFTQGSFIFCRGCLQNFSGQHFSKYCQAFH